MEDRAWEILSAEEEAGDLESNGNSGPLAALSNLAAVITNPLGEGKPERSKKN
jgi:hypothetical protein